MVEGLIIVPMVDSESEEEQMMLMVDAGKKAEERKGRERGEGRRREGSKLFFEKEAMLPRSLNLKGHSAHHARAVSQATLLQANKRYSQATIDSSSLRS